ncbi:hypothetical protein, partial [Desulfobacter sp.]
ESPPNGSIIKNALALPARCSNSKFESVRHLALNLARALARNNTASKSMIKSTSKKKAGREDSTLFNLELLGPVK